MSTFNKGDKVKVLIETMYHNDNVSSEWYDAEVVDSGQDQQGLYVKVLLFPTTIWGEEVMTIRNLNNISYR